jgi:hypothetical protein
MQRKNSENVANSGMPIKHLQEDFHNMSKPKTRFTADALMLFFMSPKRSKSLGYLEKF